MEDKKARRDSPVYADSISGATLLASRFVEHSHAMGDAQYAN